MKKILFTILLVLGVTLANAQDTTQTESKTDFVIQQVDDEMVDVFLEAMGNKDFKNVVSNYFADSLNYVSTMSGLVYQNQTKEDMLAYLNQVVMLTTPVEYRISFYSDSGYGVYVIEYLYIFYDEDGQPVADSLSWYFVEDDGVIVEIHGP